MSDVVRAFVGLGSNLGDSALHLEQAYAALDALPHTHLVRHSSRYRSAPIGKLDQPDFVNAVAELETSLSAHALLRALAAIEQEHGRVRVERNGPRTLDLDVLLYADQLIDTPELVVPHPRMHERAFVLQPLAELDDELVIPGRGTVRDLLPQVVDQRVERASSP